MPADPLAKAVETLQKKYGDDVLVVPNTEPFDCVPTGMPGLDAALGQPGLPRGKLVQFFGRESVGKYLTCQTISAHVVETGGRVFYIDDEYSVDGAFLEAVGLKLGPQFLVTQMSIMEHAFAIAIKLAQTGKIDLIVIDSVAGMLPLADWDRMVKKGKMTPTPGSHSKALSGCLLLFLPIIKEYGVACLMTNHLRARISSYGGGEHTAGGNALKYYSHAMFRLRRLEWLKDGSQRIGMKIEVRNEKNKVGVPWRTAEFNMLFGTGINLATSLFDELVSRGIVSVSRSGWCKSEALDLNIRGRRHFKDAIEEDPEILALASELVGRTPPVAAPLDPVTEIEFGEDDDA